MVFFTVRSAGYFDSVNLMPRHVPRDHMDYPFTLRFFVESVMRSFLLNTLRSISPEKTIPTQIRALRRRAASFLRHPPTML